MLERVLRYLRNWFVTDIQRGDFIVESGGIVLPFLRQGQYYRIVGSTLNDGIHQYGDGTELANEEFNGEVWGLEIPPSLLETVKRIEEWQQKHGEAEHSPFQSESFGGYSYTKKADSDVFSAFRSDLNAWRKV